MFPPGVKGAAPGGFRWSALLSPTMGYLLLILALYVLAVSRVTRFVTRDRLTQSARTWLVRVCGEKSMITYLFHCPACLSVWVAFAVAPIVIVYAGLGWWLLPFLALGCSQATILLTYADRAAE